MVDPRRASLVVALLISTAMTVAACGGAATPTTTGGQPTPSAAAPTPAAPTPEATVASVEPSVGVLPSFDLGGLTNNLSNVDSYQISIAIEGSTVYHATVVTRPDQAEEITLGEEGADSTRIVKIGTETWVATGGEPYTKDEYGMATALLGSFDPLLLFGAFAEGNIAAASTDLGTQQKNGITARHYRFDSTSSVAGTFAVPPGVALEFWVADDGYLVAYEFTGAADEDISINVTNVNDPANQVVRPD